MRLTKEILLKEKEALQEQIQTLQQDLLAKDGAVQMLEGLLKKLAAPRVREPDKIKETT